MTNLFDERYEDWLANLLSQPREDVERVINARIIDEVAICLPPASVASERQARKTSACPAAAPPDSRTVCTPMPTLASIIRHAASKLLSWD